MKTPEHSALGASDVATMAKIAGIPVHAEVATRIAASMGTALKGFDPIAGTLPFDLEPANFVVVQNGSDT